MIAPLIPLWGVAAFVGMQQAAGTRYAAPFLALMGLLFLALFGYVATHVVRARQQGRVNRKAGRG